MVSLRWRHGLGSLFAADWASPGIIKSWVTILMKIVADSDETSKNVIALAENPSFHANCNA